MRFGVTDSVHGEEVRDGVDQLAREQHAGLRRIGADVREDRLELGLDELGRKLLHGRDA
jgi:hypothetical protein